MDTSDHERLCAFGLMQAFSLCRCLSLVAISQSFLALGAVQTFGVICFALGGTRPGDLCSSEVYVLVNGGVHCAGFCSFGAEGGRGMMC